MSGGDGPVGPVPSVGGTSRVGSRPGRREPRSARDQEAARGGASPFGHVLDAATTPLPVRREVDPLAALEQLTELHLREKGFRAAVAGREPVVEQSLVDFLS